MIEERKIIIAGITSTEFLNQVHGIWSTRYFESNTAKRIAKWIIEYYTTYNKAPGREIESIFYAKVKAEKISKDVAEEIEQNILPGLSAEYEREDFNLQFAVTNTIQYFNERNLTLYSGTIQAHLQKGDLQNAEKTAREYLPLDTTVNNLNNFIQSVGQIRRHKKAPPLMLMKPWLREGQLTILYGGYGTGKTLLSVLIAYLLGLKDYFDYEIGEWRVQHPTGTLYIDGEMGEQEMEERITQYEWIEHGQHSDHRIRIFSVPEYQLATENSFYLSDRQNQLKIIHWLKEHQTYKLVVLDSASTLFGLVDENNNSEWNVKVNPFLRDLRALGVACLLLHHSGKDSKKGLRGASAMGAMAHNIFRISNWLDKKEGSAWFTLTKDKQRSKGVMFKQFSMQFELSEDGKQTKWKVTNTD